MASDYAKCQFVVDTFNISFGKFHENPSQSFTLSGRKTFSPTILVILAGLKLN